MRHVGHRREESAVPHRCLPPCRVRVRRRRPGDGLGSIPPVTYGIVLHRIPPGLTLSDLLAEPAAAGVTGLAPLALDGTGRAAWERVVARVTGELGPVDVEEYPTHLELWRHGPAGTFQVCFYGDSADLEIPYRYAGASAAPIMAEAYRAAIIVAEETGMAAHDAEVDQPVTLTGVARAAARLGGVTAWARERLT